ncbi:sarcosine oxidase subunit gamma [Litchfieldella anticariensis FP35 = DSM 16096]|uniref:Sarcosine oxidase subunit gamma n=1 Tax=Litchfieldella anticariensis (strain DSM 16096 / CECT 5854 / CIP 108499 / LMG 22089 / FP35) TaxID=1121939 RepID=S2KP31_LITA3|nr:sarcosine oxidase subunit gamma family protein [Halomonas anticariensis]EPC02223.1 sarcosine oxidase subunit gamma [Halomonas anticariensis FP35 = DSM 16096]
MSNVATFDTRTEANIPVESPLAYSYRRSGTPAVTTASRVVLKERALLGHLILRGGAIVLDEALREELGINLPGQPQGLVLDASGERSVQWLSPDEWLIIVPGGEEFELENRLRARLGDAHYSIVNVGGGQTVLELSGEKAREVLMKSVVYDVHPSHFPVGKGVTTVFAKATVIIRRPTEDCWELVVRRSFADYCYRWLLDAGEEYGIGVAK